MGRVTLPSGTPAEVARPSGRPTAGLVIAPDIMGLRPLFDRMCARLAAENQWGVAACEPFPGREHLTLEEREIGSNDDERVLGDLAAAADLLGVEPVGVLGFCQGGMWAFKAAGTGRFHRAVAFYGMIRVDWARPGHAQPLEWLRKPEACPVLALVAGQDKLVPFADAQLLADLDHVKVVAYPDAEHGFAHDPARPTHRAEDAADAWSRALSFLSA
ncbi:MAG TPA: dienelactone hydrolase family protein [Acidimicrobiales bacterium]|nr:dienelactone hydrolase family protein [Acidimicrobiales bacterium]